jgi:hypothetical protein
MKEAGRRSARTESEDALIPERTFTMGEERGDPAASKVARAVRELVPPARITEHETIIPYSLVR